MRVSLFGIGYVGSVSAACLARDGHVVVAVDTNPDKVALFNQGRAPLIEPGLDRLIASAVAGGRLRATMSAVEAIADSEVSIVCVGTPSKSDGSLNLKAVERVAIVIGRAIAEKKNFHVVVVRSTLTPGAMLGRIAPLIERAAGSKRGVGFGLAYNPEFLREGAAIRDYDDPSLSIVAVTDPRTLSCLYALQPSGASEPGVVSFGEAEAVKMVSNLWHATKVSFANEVGSVLAGAGLDSHRVMNVVCEDRRLNVSPAYMRPGFAFGGSCLPKDLRAFGAMAHVFGTPAPMLDATLATNRNVIEKALALVRAAGRGKVSMIGVAFKPGTDDLRESPYLTLAEHLIAEGYDLRIFDPGVQVEGLTGANLAYVKERLPELVELLTPTLEDAVRRAETLVLAHPGPGAAALDMTEERQHIVDLVRVRPGLRTSCRYAGLSW